MEPATHIKSRRRGITFLETVCAVALLGIVAATMFGAFNSMMGAQKRQQHRLNAMELANRLILQYLDDAATMPTRGLPILYNTKSGEPERYHWDLTEIPVKLEPARPEVAEERSTIAPITVDRMQAITVRVWLSEESGGSFQYTTEVPAVTLTRLMDPIAMRNPDTTKYLAKNPQKQAELLERYRMVGRNPTSGQRPRTPGGTRPSAPAPKATPAATPSKGGNGK